MPGAKGGEMKLTKLTWIGSHDSTHQADRRTDASRLVSWSPLNEQAQGSSAVRAFLIELCQVATRAHEICEGAKP